MPLSTLRYLLGLAGVFLRFRLHHLVPAQHIPSRMGRGLLAVLRLVLPARKDMSAQLAAALASRGPVYIKLGQLLSTRPDIFGHAICQGLAQLQDRVPPFAEQDAMKIIQQALGEPALAAFEHIEARPIASASDCTGAPGPIGHR
jgi:ubiquinone biosynthesis protein